MDRYVCIHGHFYQPPRENPWLEAIELQDPAYPYHDWNARITAESYAANAASRILDDEGRIRQIVNNYAKISFNFGPTLLAWMTDHAPGVYRAIIEADVESQKSFSGHGSAIAQVYNHVILPLANRRDKYTQIRWGIRDFEYRFGRRPEGMWLPETAVDLEGLDIMAEEGIRFTILAPHQASRVRAPGGRAWRDVSEATIDPTRAYLQRLRSGRAISLFFYDGPIARAVAFEGLLSKGDHLASRIVGAFSEARTGTTGTQLVHIATDGETYGHHHHHGDMALAYALNYIESKQLARLTNYAEYLAKHPPTDQVEIVENTAWSCAHGVERWRSDCGCNSGGNPRWNQQWRGPLRQALDWLRETLAPPFEQKARELLRDPWAARDDYITVILDRSPETVERFLLKHALRELVPEERITVLKLLELQRHAMLMYTSCGWFFDELSGIETVQLIQYAGRAVQLAEELFSDSIESAFVALLKEAKSNVPEHRDGSVIYEKAVTPAKVNWEKVGAHYAINSLFEDYGERARVHCYTVDRNDYQKFEAGKAKLIFGYATLSSEITQESAAVSFGALHLGDHNLTCGVQSFRDNRSYTGMVRNTAKSFLRADLPEVLRLLDHYFGNNTYSLRSMFRDEQRKIANLILSATVADAEAAYRPLYKNNAPLIRFLTDMSIPLPRAFHAAAELVLNSNLRRAFEAEEPDLERIVTLMEEVQEGGISLDVPTLSYALGQTIERLADRFSASPTEITLLKRLEVVAGLVRWLPFEASVWKLQNLCYELLQTTYPGCRSRAAEGNQEAQTWVEHFETLSHTLWLRVP